MIDFDEVLMKCEPSWWEESQRKRRRIIIFHKQYEYSNEYLSSLWEARPHQLFFKRKEKERYTLVYYLWNVHGNNRRDIISFHFYCVTKASSNIRSNKWWRYKKQVEQKLWAMQQKRRYGIIAPQTRSCIWPHQL